MNDADAKVKQQIVEKIKSSTNILVTVSKDPSVDDLSAALGLTALLNKLDKHAQLFSVGQYRQPLHSWIRIRYSKILQTVCEIL